MTIESIPIVTMTSPKINWLNRESRWILRVRTTAEAKIIEKIWLKKRHGRLVQLNKALVQKPHPSRSLKFRGKIMIITMA